MNYTLRKAKVKYDYPMVAEGGNEEYFQKLEFTSEQLPEITMWQPGGEYLLVVKVKETSHEIKMKDGESKECAYFDVVEVGAIKDVVDYVKKLKLK